MSDLDKERAENKVRKLMAMAKDHGATEQEVETALRQADALIRKHNIQLAELMVETNAAPTFDWGSQFVAYGRYGKTTWVAKTVPTWFGVVAMGVAVFTDTIVKQHRKASLGAGVGFYGESSDVELAVWMMEYLRDSVFWQAHAQKDLDRAGKEAFRRGMAARLQRRLKDLRAERDTELVKTKETSTALAVIERKQAQRDEYFGFKQETKNVAVRVGNGYQRGAAAADRVGLHRPLAGHNEQRRLA